MAANLDRSAARFQFDRAGAGTYVLQDLQGSRPVKTVTAREANQRFSKLLAEIEAGEQITITKHGKPVAVLSPHRPPAMTPERKAAIERAIETTRKGLPWPKGALRRFTRDEMHER
jgi:prevent-host-death family protein